MKSKHAALIISSVFIALISHAATTSIELKASKDTFGRSTHRNRNSGASEHLLISHRPSVVTLIAFDLSAVTNEIKSAEFSFRMHETKENPINVVIAPMAQTKSNAAWNEGIGTLGHRGQNARIGEATYQWRHFRDIPWESVPGKPAINLGYTKLWGSPLARTERLEWKQGGWVTVKINNVALLESTRTSDLKTITLGLWGISGNGLYRISSKESGHAAKLMLKVDMPEQTE